jgi:hypothetical protein
VIVLVLLAIAGAPLDRGDFRTARALGDVKPGLVSLVLDADAVARSRDLADVRIVDAHDNQVPYIVEVRTTPAIVPMRVPAATRDGSSSIYHFALPYSGKLELTTSARVFERNVTLQRRRQFWDGTDPDKPAPPLVLDCRTTDVDVVIDDGDNAPLPITTARIVLPGYALRFTAPGGPLTLLYGASIAAPHYDIALISSRLLAQPAREMKLPPFARSEPHPEKRVFWIAIVVAVAALLAILGRLLIRT